MQGCFAGSTGTELGKKVWATCSPGVQKAFYILMYQIAPVLFSLTRTTCGQWKVPRSHPATGQATWLMYAHHLWGQITREGGTTRPARASHLGAGVV